MADDLSVNDPEIGEIEGILQDENGHIKRGAEEHNAREVYDAAEKVRKAVVLATRHSGELEQKVEENADELEAEVETLRSYLESDFGGIPDLSDNIDDFLDFFDLLEAEVLESEEDLSPDTLKFGGNGRLVLRGGKTYGLQNAISDIEVVIKNDLNPLTQRINYEDEHVELETLNRLIKQSVSLHVDLNEYRQLLYLAVEDEELLEQFNQNEKLPELNQADSDIRNSKEQLIERIKEIEEIEERVIDALEEASRLISDRLNYDESLLEEVRKRLGSDGAGFRGSTEGYFRVLEAIEQKHTSGRITSEWEDAELGNFVETLEDDISELQQQLNYIIQNYSKEEQEIYRLNEAIQNYVNEHSQLMREGENMSESLSAEGPSGTTSFDSQEFDPRSDEVPDQAWQLKNVAGQILDYGNPQDLLEEYKEVEEEFKRAYEIEGRDKEGIENFEESLNTVHRKLKTLFEKAEELAESSSFGGEEKGATRLTENDIETLIKGDRRTPGFEEVIEDIEKLSSRIQRLHSVEESERNTFAELKEDLERVLSDVESYLELWSKDEGEGYLDLHREMVGQRWDGRGVEAADLWGAARRTAAYKLFMDDTDVSSLDEAEEKFKREIEEHHQIVEMLKQEIEESEELLEQEVVLIEGDGDNKGELEELQDTIRELEDFRTDFIEVVKSTESVTESMPSELVNKLDKVESRIEEIEEELETIENAKEDDDKDVSHLFKDLERESTAFDDGSSELDIG